MKRDHLSDMFQKKEDHIYDQLYVETMSPCYYAYFFILTSILNYTPGIEMSNCNAYTEMVHQVELL